MSSESPFVFSCCAAILLMIMWYFQKTETDMQTFQERQSTTGQATWDLFCCMTFWWSLTKSLTSHHTFAFLHGTNNYWFMHPLSHIEFVSLSKNSIFHSLFLCLSLSVPACPCMWVRMHFSHSASRRQVPDRTVQKPATVCQINFLV